MTNELFTEFAKKVVDGSVGGEMQVCDKCHKKCNEKLMFDAEFSFVAPVEEITGKAGSQVFAQVRMCPKCAMEIIAKATDDKELAESIKKIKAQETAERKAKQEAKRKAREEKEAQEYIDSLDPEELEEVLHSHAEITFGPEYGESGTNK